VAGSGLALAMVAAPHNRVRVRVSMVELVAAEVRRVGGVGAGPATSGGAVAPTHRLDRGRWMGLEGPRSDMWQLPHGVTCSESRVRVILIFPSISVSCLTELLCLAPNISINLSFLFNRITLSGPMFSTSLAV
jgi:hypothetical protein